jgi:cholest-4-en-3-one 26-monooxygenase
VTQRLPPPAGVADLGDPDTFVDGPPHGTFRRLRAEAPVAFFPEKDGPGFWAVTRYDDVRSVSLDQSVFSSWRGGVMLRDFPEDLLAAQRETLPSMPVGTHGKHRRLVSGAFGPKVMRALEPRIRDLATRILDAVAPRGTCDFVTDVASELPVQVICELIGIPLEDRKRVVEWSNAIVGMDDAEYAGTAAEGPLAAMQLYAYAGELAAARRAAPRDDVASLLLASEVDGERLGDAQFNAFMLVLAVAGNETTRNAISGGLLALFDHPDARRAVQADPSRLPTAVEEILRWVTPVMHFRRTAERDVVLAGQQIREGDKVVVWYTSANRDEAVFPHADRFDVARTPNEHLTFGFGPHFCLGAALARLEIRILFEELFRRLPDVASAGPTIRMRANHIAGIKHLPIRYTPT